MSPLTVLILIACIVGAFGFIDEATELNFSDLPSSSEDLYDQISESEGRIVNGRFARPAQFPHQVSIRILGSHHVCGGSILNRLFILTAAQCTQGHLSIPANVTVVVGGLRLVNSGVFYRVRSIYNHPEFNRTTRSNDISIIRTVNDILFTERIRPVILPISNVPVEGTLRVTISGWGRLTLTGNQARDLKYINALTLSLPACRARLQDWGRFVYENTVCVENPPSQGICRGDQGGALITNSGVQVGVASWHIYCGHGIPDVYANVWSHIEWIKETIRANWD